MGKYRFGVILDAGSSGSRVYVYRWLHAQEARRKGDDEDLTSLPVIKTKKHWHMKVKPGISTFGETPEDVGADHLKALVDFALDIVPREEVENTPIFLLATAGMRLLPAYQREAVLENVCAYFQTQTKFHLPDCALHVQVIPGETEGLYGWIAANSLLGGFDAPDTHHHGKGHHTYGFLDMGGASAQIAFAPNATEAKKHADDLTLLRLRAVDGTAKEYRVFVTTWLGFGANEARRRYVDALLRSSKGQVMRDPCLPTGLLVDKMGKEITAGSPESSEPHLVGTGNFTACLTRTFPLLEKEMPCVDKPCLLNGVHTPAIDFDVNHFVGVSEYWHTTHEVFAMAHKDKAYDFHTYQKQVTDFCSREWKDIEKDVAGNKWGDKVDEKTVEEVCFKASWLINMLHDGIGVPRVGLEPIKQPGVGWSNKTNAAIDKAKDRGFLDAFQAVDKIDGTEVSWTLGKMVLYASSQMPPANEALAVGFGSNINGTELPEDFHFAGGSPLSLPTDTMQDDDHDADDWHDRILSSDYSRRVPGILIFLLILVLAVYLLCGRERRLALNHKLFTLIGRKPSPSAPRAKRRKPPGFLSSKLFGGGSHEPAYERVLEGADHHDFELGDISPRTDEGHNSDSSLDTIGTTNPSRTGRTSGWATPAATRGLSPDFARSSPKTKGYFDSVGGGNGSGTPGPGLSAGLGITPFDRVGLVVRTESKERLAPAPRSRAGSPTRRSPLLMTPSFLKES